MFFGFNSAVSGLLASQRSLYTTNHNIDNANTKGYSRQEIEQRATKPFNMPGIGFLGTGTEIHNVERVRDSFVDFKYWNEIAPKAEWEIKKNQLLEIEKLMAEPTDNSFRRYMDDFYGSLDEMSKNSSDMSYREPVKQNAMAFTKHINETAKKLENMKRETNYEIRTEIKTINGLSQEIVGLNKQIYSSEVSGKKANDLRDKRELLVDEMAEIVPIKVNESSDGKYKVSVGGMAIVDHIYTNEVSLKEVKNANDTEYKIVWENGGEVNLKSGRLKGLMDMMTGNGENNSYRGVPYYTKQLDDFAREFAKGFNSVHKEGYGLASQNPAGDFFVDADNSDVNITAANITLSNEILEDIRNIGAAGNKGGSSEDNINLLKLINQRENKEFFKKNKDVSQGTPDDFIKSILSSMAVDSLQANRLYDTQELMQKNIETKRQSISGVSLDEEMADMVRFQHVYIASSKMISTMDMLIDVTVNRLGLVGR